MTKHRQRYLAQYPERIHRKRMKRAKQRIRVRASKRNDARHFRKILQEFVATHPQQEPIRAGKQGIANKIMNVFRKPTI